MILGVKLDRRLMAAVALDGEQFVFQDSRFVASHKPALEAALTNYFDHLLEQVYPAAVYYYAPTGTDTQTAHTVRLLIDAAGRRGVPAKPLTKLDVFGGFGLLPFRTRHELRDHLSQMWPALATAKRHRQVALAEATATAFVGEFQQELPDL